MDIEEHTFPKSLFQELRTRVWRRQESHVRVKRLRTRDIEPLYTWPLHMELVKVADRCQQYAVLVGTVVSVELIFPLDRENQDLRVVVVPYLV